MPGAHGVENYLNVVEEVLVRKYKARPHWGKNHHLNHDTIKELYPQLETWEQVYHIFNKDKIFDNAFTVRCGFCKTEDYAYIEMTKPIIGKFLDL